MMLELACENIVEAFVIKKHPEILTHPEWPTQLADEMEDFGWYPEKKSFGYYNKEFGQGVVGSTVKAHQAELRVLFIAEADLMLAAIIKALTPATSRLNHLGCSPALIRVPYFGIPHMPEVGIEIHYMPSPPGGPYFLRVFSGPKEGRFIEEPVEYQLPRPGAPHRAKIHEDKGAIFRPSPV